MLNQRPIKLNILFLTVAGNWGKGVTAGKVLSDISPVYSLTPQQLMA